MHREDMAEAGQPHTTGEQGSEEHNTPKRLSIKENIAWNSFGSIVNLACQYLIGIAIVRLDNGFGAAGIYSLALSVYYVFSSVAEYRMTTVQVSDMRDENSTGEYFAFRLITCGIAMVMTLVYMIFTCSYDTWLAIFLFLVYRYVMLIIAVLHACNQRHMRLDYTGKSNFFQGVFALAVFIVVFWSTYNLELTFFLMAVAVALVGIFYTYPRTRQFGPIDIGISKEKTLHLLVSCVPIVAAGIAFGASASVPKQYLAATLGNAALGAYASVSQPVTIIQTGASYIYSPLLGYFSEAFIKKDAAGFKRLFKKTARGIAAVCALCVAGLLVLGEPILVLLCGEVIRPYCYLLGPLALFSIGTAAASFLSDLAIALRSFKTSFIGSVIELVVSLAVMIPIITSMGMVGVSVVGIIATVVAVIVMFVMLIRHVRSCFAEEKEA
jgi:O-antigen/teichoic acid export membrane protein